jgi:hypothetical protein
MGWDAEVVHMWLYSRMSIRVSSLLLLEIVNILHKYCYYIMDLV